MFKKKGIDTIESLDTLIGPNSIFEGNIASEGTIRIEGRIRGDVKVNGDVFIGNNGLVKGNISANNVHLSGTVEGNINAKGLLRILSTAKLFGDIKVQSIVADESSIFQGKCSMKEAAAAVTAATTVDS